MKTKKNSALNLWIANQVISSDGAIRHDESEKMQPKKSKLLNLRAAQRVISHGGAKMWRVDPLAGRIIDARQHFAAQREKECNLSSASRHYIDSGTLQPNPGGRQRVCTTFATKRKHLFARSNNTMRREIINQGLMYVIISLFVFLMMPLLRFVS